MTPTPPFSRRHFLGGLLGAAATAPMASLAAAEPAAAAPSPAPAAPPSFDRKIKLGVVGNGGRGAWIAGLFRDHGGFDLWSVADYFPAVADACGEAVGVPPERRFSTLSGYRRLMESGVEAVALEAIPYWYPEHARAAVAAGLHVYMAKPVAVDVPGALEIRQLGAQATQARKAFLVDYQMPTDPINQEVVRRIRAGGLGRLAQIHTMGVGGPMNDQPIGDTIEDRMQNLIWVSDAALGCDHIGNYGIHALDAALWVMGTLPVAASGGSRRVRANAYGDSCDVCSVIFEYPDGTLHTHFGEGLPNSAPGDLSATFHGNEAHAILAYWGRSYVRGGPQHYGGGNVDDLYTAGARRNIARFYTEIATEQPVNDTCDRSVDGVLVSLLAQAAGARGTRVTMEQLLHENRRCEVNLRGLKT
jgi:myo-inositol 2-dehydrogenase / D-chiro-inositol 1-dehydrogenase